MCPVPIRRTTSTRLLRFGEPRMAVLQRQLTAHLDIAPDGLLKTSPAAPAVLSPAAVSGLSAHDVARAQILVSAAEMYADFRRGDTPSPPKNPIVGSPPRSLVATASGVLLDEILGLRETLEKELLCRHLSEQAQQAAQTATAAVGPAMTAYAAALQYSSAASTADGDVNQWQAEADAASAGTTALDTFYGYYLQAEHAAAQASAVYSAALAAGCGNLAEISSAASTAQGAAHSLDQTWNSGSTLLIAMVLQGATNDWPRHKAICDRAAAAEQQRIENLVQGIGGPGGVADSIQVNGRWYGVDCVLDEPTTQKFRTWLTSVAGNSTLGNLKDVVTAAAAILGGKADLPALGKMCWSVLLSDASMTNDIIGKTDSGSGVTVHISAVAAVAESILTMNPAFAFTSIFAGLLAEDAMGGFSSGVGGWKDDARAPLDVLWITGN